MIVCLSIWVCSHRILSGSRSRCGCVDEVGVQKGVRLNGGPAHWTRGSGTPGGLRLLCIGSGLSGHSGPMEALQGHAFHAQEAEHMTAVKFYWMKQDLKHMKQEAMESFAFPDLNEKV